MKRTKLAYLLMLPALLLTACGDGNEIKDQEKIDEIESNISNKVLDVNCFELSVKLDSSSYDKDTDKNINVKADIKYQINEAGDKYLKSTGTNDGVKSESTIYLVKNEKYKQVLYVSSYNPDTKENDVTVYGYDGNEMTFGFSGLYFLVGEAYYTAFADPLLVDYSTISSSSENVEYDADVKYYSKGDDNLTVKANIKAKGEVDKNADEYTVSGNYTVRYENGYFKSAIVDGTSNKGNKSKNEVNVTIKKDLKIELPKGWEDLINKNSISGLA